MHIRRTVGTLALGATLALTGCDDIVGAGDDALIIVQNNSSLSVHYLFISECSDDTWGEDWLGQDVISPGEDESFRVDPGCYDLRAEWGDDSFAEDRDIQLDEGDEFTWELVD